MVSIREIRNHASSDSEGTPESRPDKAKRPWHSPRVYSLSAHLTFAGPMPVFDGIGQS
jgi:hypothetical protein